ncbi:MAG: DNA polymerase III subunit beta [Desulfobacteraceae bacterium]|nr:DNA polymerase III subunit beta [Desulfobacteraceae bacterium]
MKFSINKSDIVDVLSKIQGLTSRKSSLAITECIKIKAQGDNVHLAATDLETGYEGTLPALVEAPGVIAISAKKFYEIIREFPSTAIEIQETENRWINIGNKNVQFNLKSMNPDDFPDRPQIESIDFIEIESAALKDMIDKSLVIGGMGEDKKPHINGIWFERLTDQSPAIIRMVSTDGGRLSKYDFVCSHDMQLSAAESVLIPKKGLSEVSKFLGSKEKIQAGPYESYFVVKSAMEIFYIRMLEGSFPAYDTILFRDEGIDIEMEKEPFLYMLKRMSILCTDNYRAANFRFEDNNFIINAANPEIGDSTEDMIVEYAGQAFEAAFNPRLFIDAVNGIDDNLLKLNIITPKKACLINGAENSAYVCAIMPMRV